MRRRSIIALILFLLTGTTVLAAPSSPIYSFRQPGVYTEEIPSSNQPITGVPTSNAAFIGIADQGPLGRATLITAWNQFINQFGGFRSNGYLGYAVYSFFQEGGTRCYIVRVSGSAALRSGLNALDPVTDVNIISIPDWAGDHAAITTTLSYCQKRSDCFLIADPPAGNSLDEVIRFKTGNYSLNSSYGALYYPWLVINDPSANQKKLIPPSGSVAGRYSFTDATHGVHKAPSGTTNGRLKLTKATETTLRNQNASQLSSAGINPILSTPTEFCIWGARTLSQDPEWKYLTIRRQQIYIEQSIRNGLSWVAFQTSDPSLWSRVHQSINPFLTRLWRAGAFMGSKQDEAFFIKIDAENNPPASSSRGKLFITVGFAPIRPAEFIIINISMNIRGN